MSRRARIVAALAALLLAALLAVLVPPALYAHADESQASPSAPAAKSSDAASGRSDIASGPSASSTTPSGNDAESSDSASGSSDGASSRPAASSASDASAAQRAQEAIAACVAGLYAGYGVQDSAGFYASDDLLADDGSCEWLAFDVYRAGATDGANVFLDRMERYVTDAYASETQGLDAYSPTTWARTALVAGTLGADPAAFGTDAKGKPADLLSDGLYNWAYTGALSDQGANALIYALQALDALHVDVPANARYSARDMVDGILACQTKDGSFALSEGSKSGSVDLTGMALAALGPHAGDVEVDAAIDAGVAYLEKAQAADGSFESEGQSTSESCSMVIVGLSACGIDAAADPRFVKEGGSALDALLGFAKPDGTFAHTADAIADAGVKDLPTEQALRALLAYVELSQAGDGNVYSSDVALSIEGVGSGQAGAAEPQPVQPASIADVFKSMGVGAAAALVVVAIIWGVRKLRRKARR